VKALLFAWELTVLVAWLAAVIAAVVTAHLLFSVL